MIYLFYKQKFVCFGRHVLKEKLTRLVKRLLEGVEVSKKPNGLGSDPE